jgi:regulator of sigma E protease
MFNAGTLYALPQLGFVLGVMVLVHEFGHFAAAKLCRVRVEAFAIGFGKKLLGWESGGTSYQLNLLPLGGYVKMAGEMPGEEHHSDDPGEFQNHPRWQRMIITLAGPVANFILSIALMTGLFMAHHETDNYVNQPVIADYISPGSAMAKTGIQTGDRIVHIDSIENPSWSDVAERAALDATQTTPFAYLHNGKRVNTMLALNWHERREFDPNRDLGLVPLEQDSPVVVKELVDGAPAKAAGLQVGDQIVAIDKEHLHSVAALIAYLQDGAGKPVVLSVERKTPQGQKAVEIPVTPIDADAQEGKQWQTGFRPVPPPSHLDHLTLPQALAESLDFNAKNSKLIFVVLQRLFTNQVSIKSLSSPIGIGVQVHQAFEMSSIDNVLPVVALMAMISLNLGIFNLLPIPILDGGMMVFLLIESVIRRDLNPRFKERIYQVAFVCILLFAAVVIFNDITKFLPVHPKS